MSAASAAPPSTAASSPSLAARTSVDLAKVLIARNHNTEPFLVIHAVDRPLAAQVSAATAEEAAEAARILEGRGFDAVDMNLGCPVRKIAAKSGKHLWPETPMEPVPAA